MMLQLAMRAAKTLGSLKERTSQVPGSTEFLGDMH